MCSLIVGNSPLIDRLEMAKVIRKRKITSREELEKLDKNELIDRLLSLEAHNQQLKNVILKSEKGKDSPVSKEITPGQRKFDFTKCHKRHIFMKLYYLGWDYQGFATQEDSPMTIEHHLFSALTRACLIADRESSNYHRCGRTDKGVSAFSQVISIDIRSKLEPSEQDKLDEEIKYCKLLNKILPKNIRIISWSPADPEISARFDCKCRSYKYFFPRGNLDIDAMNQAAKYIIGSHDFRNLCKMDVANGVTSFIRNVKDASVTCIDSGEKKVSGYDMCELSIKSNAFLWHQIRCIMGILLLIGERNEKPEVIKELLDVEKCQRKPQYCLAHYIPLNLFSVEYDNTNWYIDTEEFEKVIKDLQEEWGEAEIKATMMKSMLKDLTSSLGTDEETVCQQSGWLLQGVKSKIYRPLMERDTCESLEERIDHYTKKQRLEKTS
uniref:Pseudouridine synthase I TruA alpha/beta domain-containing protein n=1 Tax=Trichogramma kaykai TaxID=54128 RepID=A0ABD2XFS0_9HYME